MLQLSSMVSTSSASCAPRLALGIADGWVKADGKVIYEAKDLRVGLFTSAQLRDQKTAEPA